MRARKYFDADLLLRDGAGRHEGLAAAVSNPVSERDLEAKAGSTTTTTMSLMMRIVMTIPKAEEAIGATNRRKDTESVLLLSVYDMVVVLGRNPTI